MNLIDRVMHGGIHPYVIKKTVNDRTETLTCAHETNPQNNTLNKEQFDKLIHIVKQKFIEQYPQEHPDNFIGKDLKIELDIISVVNNPDYKSLGQRLSLFGTSITHALFTKKTMVIVTITAIATVSFAQNLPEWLQEIINDLSSMGEKTGSITVREKTFSY